MPNWDDGNTAVYNAVRFLCCVAHTDVSRRPRSIRGRLAELRVLGYSRVGTGSGINGWESLEDVAPNTR